MPDSTRASGHDFTNHGIFVRFCKWAGFYWQEQMTESQQLLAEYAENGSEEAFRELVKRYIDLVYSTARRLAGGDAHLAQDIAQTVFIHLCHNARKLPREVMLGGWLRRQIVTVQSFECPDLK